MTLAEHQASVARVCLDREAPASDLAALGSEDRWAIYRSMVRSRMQRVCATAFRRTGDALGEGTLEALVDDWLATAPPTTRFFRDLPGQMARWTLAREDALTAPAHARDLLRYELAVWEVKAADDRDLPAVVEFSFEGVPAFSPASELLSVEHGVDQRAEDGSVEPFDGALLVFRTPDFRGRCLRLNPLAHALVRELREAGRDGRAVTDAVQRAATAQGVAIDESLIDGLSSLLEKLLTRGVLRGCLSVSPPGASDEAQ